MEEPLLKEVYMTHNLGNAEVNTIVGKVNIEYFYTIEALCANRGAGNASVENAPWAPKIIPYRKKGNWN